MEWYDKISGKDNLEIRVFGPDKLMRVNYEDNTSYTEMVISLDDYRIISSVTRPKGDLVLNSR